MKHLTILLLSIIILLIINKYFHTTQLQKINVIGTNKIWIYHQDPLNQSYFETLNLQNLQSNINGIMNDIIIITPDTINQYIEDFPISMCDESIPYRKRIDLLHSFILEKYGGLCISPGSIGIHLLTILSKTYYYDLVTVGGNPKIIQSNKNNQTPNTYILGSTKGSDLIKEYKSKLLESLNSNLLSNEINSYEILKHCIQKYKPLQYHFSNDGTIDRNQQLLQFDDYINKMNPNLNDDELYVISLPYENFKNSKYQWLFNLSEKEFNESDIFIKHYL